jgi:arylsulfatase A-like enzyme
VDDHIEKLLAALRRLGLYEDTLILITADHGEEFWDHGGVTHGHTLYEELVRVPLAMRLPGRLPAGTVITEQVHHVDLMPTVLDLAGVARPAQCTGLSLVPLARGNADRFQDRRVLIEVQADVELQAARTPSRKWIEGAGGRREIFDLAADPKERTDLSGHTGLEEFAPLGAELLRHRAAARAPAAGPTGPIDPRLLEKLRSLGYVH